MELQDPLHLKQKHASQRQVAIDEACMSAREIKYSIQFVIYLAFSLTTHCWPSLRHALHGCGGWQRRLVTLQRSQALEALCALGMMQAEVSRDSSKSTLSMFSFQENLWQQDFALPPCQALDLWTNLVKLGYDAWTM